MFRQKRKQDGFGEQIKAMIVESPQFGCRAAVHLADFDRNAVQPVFLLIGWQVKKRQIGLCPRVQASPFVAPFRLGAIFSNLLWSENLGTGHVHASFLLRSDNGLVFTRRSHTGLVRGYSLYQKFVTVHSLEQNGTMERVIRTLMKQCVHRHRFATLEHAGRVIRDWIVCYNARRPH